MELIHRCKNSGLQAMLVRGLGSERDSAEEEVLAAGVPLALMHRSVWASHVSHWESLFLLVRDETGRACAGVAIEEVRTRALPGHVVLRVGMFGGALTDDVRRVALEAITELANKIPRVLKVQVNLFTRNGLEETGATMRGLGFRQIRPPSSYPYTLVINLKPTEDEIFAALGRSGRKRIREVRKMSLRSLVIEDPAYADRIRELQAEAMRRTRGYRNLEDWKGILRMSKEYPNLSRVYGLFPNDDTSPENMGAFSWVCNHGDHGEYRAGGSKSRGEVRIPYGYLLMWEMIQWSKAQGAEWFDLGGVTLPGGDETALEGISEFKRSFSRETVEIGAEWVLETAPIRAKIVTAVTTGALRVRALMSK